MKKEPLGSFFYANTLPPDASISPVTLSDRTSPLTHHIFLMQSLQPTLAHLLASMGQFWPDGKGTHIFQLIKAHACE
jgi:hypothetical protein